MTGRTGSSHHMSGDEFRKRGEQLVDWVASYLETVEQRSVTPPVAPGDVYRMLPEKAPEQGESFDAIVADLDRVVMPGIVHWQSPGWFAFFPANVSGPSILGELVSAGLGQQGMLWATSPACTEIEMRVVDWLVDLMGLPQGWKTTGPGGGVIQMSASDATHLALVVARERARRSAPIDDQVVYASPHAHSSIEKGARIAGFRHTRFVATDAVYAMDAAALRDAVSADIASGLTPAAVVSSVGTTGTTAVDPVRAIGEIAAEQGMWHHVDAAFAGSAMLCPEFRRHQDGLELADSYVFNPHKWMFTNFDCSVFYVADRRPLVETMAIIPPYLRNASSEAGTVIDYRDWQVPLGRRFRALKLWFVLRWYGAEGLRHHIREHVALARDIAARIDADDRFAVVAPVPFSLVCFRHVAGDEATDAVAAALNESGEVHVTASQLPDGRMIRLAVGQAGTERRHVDRLWELIDAAG